MKEDEFKLKLTERRKDLNLTYKAIQRDTGLGYNTVRRVFDDPWNCRIGSVLRILTSIKCELVFAVEDKIGDELESPGGEDGES